MSQELNIIEKESDFENPYYKEKKNQKVKKIL